MENLDILDDQQSSGNTGPKTSFVQWFVVSLLVGLVWIFIIEFLMRMYWSLQLDPMYAEPSESVGGLPSFWDWIIRNLYYSVMITVAGLPSYAIFYKLLYKPKADPVGRLFGSVLILLIPWLIVLIWVYSLDHITDTLLYLPFSLDMVMQIERNGTFGILFFIGLGTNLTGCVVIIDHLMRRTGRWGIIVFTLVGAILVLMILMTWTKIF